MRRGEPRKQLGFADGGVRFGVDAEHADAEPVCARVELELRGVRLRPRDHEQWRVALTHQLHPDGQTVARPGEDEHGVGVHWLVAVVHGEQQDGHGEPRREQDDDEPKEHR